MSSLPILDIKSFNKQQEIGEFYVNRFSTHLALHHTSITTPHKHNFYLSVLFTEGSGTHEIDFQSYEVKPGSLFVLKPGQTHSWKFTEDIEGIVFFHNEAFYDLHFTTNQLKNFPFYFSLQNTRCTYLSGESFDYIHQLYKLTLHEYETDNLLKQQKLRSLIDLIYIELSRFYIDNNKNNPIKMNGYMTLLNRFEHLVDEHYLTKKLPSQYADILNISTKHLNRISKSVLNKTSSDIITERVILEAKRMLLHAPGTVAIIADDLGYNDYSYFSRLFKQKCNETPSEFQRRYR